MSTNEALVLSSIHSAINVFLSGQCLKAIESLEKLQFPTFDILEWVRDNNILLFRSVWDKCQTSHDPFDEGLAEFLKTFENLLTKVRSIYYRSDDVKQCQTLILECIVLYNFLFFYTTRLLASTNDSSGISLHVHRSHLERTLERVVDYNKFGSPQVTSRKSDTINNGRKSNTDFPLFYLQPVLILCYCLAVSSDEQTLLDICHKFRTVEPATSKSEWKICFATPVPVGFKEKLKSSHLLVQQLALVLKTFESSEASYKPDDFVSENTYRVYIVYIKAHSLYRNCMFEAALKCIQGEEDIKYNDVQSTLFLNLEGCCYFKLGKYWSAVGKFQAALNCDFSFLVPLYNIAIVYQQQNSVQAELDTLKHLIAALNTTVTSQQQAMVYLVQYDKMKLTQCSDMYGTYVHLPHVMYLIGRRCLQENHFDEAAEYYLDLLDYFRDNNFLQPPTTWMPSCPLPSATQIYLEAAFCMVKSEKYQECIIICNWLLSCLNRNSSEFPHTISMMSYHSNRSDDDGDDDEYLFPGSSTMSNVQSYSMASVGHSPDHIHNDTNRCLSLLQTTLLALLYKADSFVHINQLDESVQTLQLATHTIKENPELLSKAPTLQQPTEKQKKVDCCSSVPLSNNTTHIQVPYIDVVQAVYNNIAVILQSRQQYKDAVHCFRLGLQISPNDLLSFNCVLTMIQLKQFESAAELWSTYRGINIKSSKTALHKQLRERKCQLQNNKDENKLSKSTSKYTEPPSSFVLLQLDIAILENVLRSREMLF